MLGGLAAGAAPLGVVSSACSSETFSVSDARGDSGNDATTSSDGGTRDDSSATGRFCPRAGSLFCNGFDEGESAPLFGFGNTYATGRLELETTLPVSPPAALRVFVPAGRPTNDSSAALIQNVNSVALQAAHLGFAVKLDSLPAGRFAEIFRLGFQQVGGPYAGDIKLVVYAASASVVAGGVSWPLDRTLSPGVWTNVDFYVSMVSRNLLVRFDGVAVGDFTAARDLAPPSVERLDIGIVYTDAAGAEQVGLTLDNVVIDTAPRP